MNFLLKKHHIVEIVLNKLFGLDPVDILMLIDILSIYLTLLKFTIILVPEENVLAGLSALSCHIG